MKSASPSSKSKSSAKSHGGIIIDRPPPPTPPPSVRLDIENNGDKRNSIDHSRPSINIDTGDILGGKNGTIKIPTISSGEIQSSGMTPISVKLPEVKLSKHHHQHKKHHRHNRKRSSPPPPVREIEIVPGGDILPVLTTFSGSYRSPLKLVGDVRGKLAIMIENILDDVEQPIRAANFLKQDEGARQVHLVGTHALLTPEAAEKLNESVIDEIVVTNTSKSCVFFLSVMFSPSL